MRAGSSSVGALPQLNTQTDQVQLLVRLVLMAPYTLSMLVVLGCAQHAVSNRLSVSVI
jgi:hypothetical protein